MGAETGRAGLDFPPTRGALTMQAFAAPPAPPHTSMTAPAPGALAFRRRLRQLHRWLGLLIALQVLAWIAGGLLMSALRLDMVRGADWAAPPEAAPLPAAMPLHPLASVLQAHAGAGPRSATLATWLGQPVYRLETSAGTKLVDARSGALLSPLPAEAARAVALADYRGPGSPAAVERVETPAIEIRERELPLWRVRFDDPRTTTLYISPDSGLVVARRNDWWRLFDFVWMLHIMDYETRDDFNHPLLIATAATALLFVISGLFMLYFSFRPRRSG